MPVRMQANREYFSSFATQEVSASAFVTPYHSDQELLLHKITRPWAGNTENDSCSYKELLPWANQET